MIGLRTSRPNNNGGGRPVYITSPIFLKESNMKKKTTPQPRNYLVKLALFRKAGSHKKSNKAIRRLEKSKKNYYSEAHLNLNRSGLVSQNLFQ